MVNKTRTSRTPRKQKRKSLASRAHLERLMKEAASVALSADCDAAVTSPSGSSLTSISECSSPLEAPLPGEATSVTRGKGKAKSNVALNYSNVLLIERFQAAVETRTAICRRLEQLVRHSPMYTPPVQNKLIRFLRDDFIRGDKTLQVIENLKHSDFISAPCSEDGIDIVQQEVTENTKMLFEGSKELMLIGDQIAISFS